MMRGRAINANEISIIEIEKKANSGIFFFMIL